MGLFNRKRRERTEAPLNDPELATRVDALRDQAPTPPARVAGSGLLRLLPIGDLIKGITGVLRDPNGKISSKRAGAGALVVAGIAFLADDKLPAGIVCLVFACCLFFLTKWDHGVE